MTGSGTVSVIYYILTVVGAFCGSPCAAMVMQHVRQRQAERSIREYNEGLQDFARDFRNRDAKIVRFPRERVGNNPEPPRAA